MVVRLEALEAGQAYGGVLGRLADAAGLELWTTRRMERMSKGKIAHAPASCAEFTDNFGQLGTIDFIRTVCRNTIGGEAEPGAAEAYAQLLNENMSRADLATALEESPESAALLSLAGAGLDLL